MEDTARLALLEQSLRDTDKFTNVLYELRRVIMHILENPHDYELRTVNSDLLLSYLKLEAFCDYLKYIGFQQIDNNLLYPKEQTLSNLRMAQAAIERKIGFCCGALSKIDVKASRNHTNRKKNKLTPANILKTKNPLLLKIESLFNNMIRYEDEDLQKKTRSFIPLTTLQLRAIDRVRDHQLKMKLGETKAKDLPFDIALLMEVLGWFKHRFFKWVDKPNCETCDGPTRFIGTITEVSKSETCIVEVYQCTRCEVGRAKFPRYNMPSTLLITRRGRCGEWANCFTLICRSLGYDTRFVYDTTDHAWCEVFDYDSKTWLHVDPCEGKLNVPLLYSHGWGKKLKYVIAVSRDDLQDVTWRYTTDHKKVLKRRNMCPEGELLAAIMALRERRQRQVSEPRRRYLARRAVEELVHLMVERKPSDYEIHGRISGSKEWRSQRGEMGAEGYIFLFNEPGSVSVQYYSAEDEYRISGPGEREEVIRTWSAGAYTEKNMFRKVETDWKKVYLAREEGENEGMICWRLQASEGVQFTSLCLRAEVATFHTGFVRWTVQFDNRPPEPAYLGEMPCRFERHFARAEVSAMLSGGLGDCGWQHAQLFRASTDSTPAFTAHCPFPAAPGPNPTTPAAVDAAEGGSARASPALLILATLQRVPRR